MNGPEILLGPLGTVSGPGLWLAAAGAAALVASAGLAWVQRRRAASAQQPVLPVREESVARPRRTASVGADEDPVFRVSRTLHNWLQDGSDATDVWTAFDQVIREALVDAFGASRVRCYAIRAGGERLRPIARPETGGEDAGGPSLREGLLGHVATTGREYVAGKPELGTLVHDLAGAEGERWSWVWPVREERSTIGLVAVGETASPEALEDRVRETVGRLLTVCWLYVQNLAALNLARHTDPGSGVLTRGDFFTAGERSLAASYRDGEPVVVAVLALEGLRRLDDAGLWRERDALIQQLGPRIARRIRTDDLVGRFADDRFVVLLRRLDSGLGRLIAEKILDTAHECIWESPATRERVTARAGLAGSGLAAPELEALLNAAFVAVDAARSRSLPLMSDVEAGAPEERGA